MRRSCLLFAVGVLLTASAGAEGQVRFVDVTQRAGIYEWLAGMMGHGGALGDFDGDGWIDIYVGGFCDRPSDQYKPADGPVPNRLLRNLGDGRFQRVAQEVLETYGRTSGAVFADLNNDGTLELYSANNARQAPRPADPEPQRSAKSRRSDLFVYRGGTWVNVGPESGACPQTLRTARNIGVFDYDGDALLDLLVIEDRFVANPRSVLLRNQGDLKFVEVNRQVGLPDDLFGLGLAVADVNGDGRPDFFVGHSNRFFLSTGDGRYVEPASLRETFAWQPLHGEDWPCGAAFGDLNRDGLLDLVLSIHCETARNRVYLNEGLHDGVPRFRDVTRQVGFPASVPNKCPHVEIQDFDNDGWMDIYLSAAWLDDDGTITPLVFRNRGLREGLPHFEPPRPLQGPMVYFPAGPSGDVDNDGRIDLFLINWFQGNHCRLLRNVSPVRHWLDVQVVGRTINRMGIGAQVEVYPAGRLGEKAALLGFQEISTGYGYASGQPAVAHFGLDTVDHVDLRIRLPNGKVLQQQNVAANQRLRVEEP